MDQDIIVHVVQLGRGKRAERGVGGMMGKLKKGRDGKMSFEAVPCWTPMLVFAGSKWFSYLKL